MSRDRAPSYQWYPRDFMADPAVQAMTWEQRARYQWGMDCSFMADSAGVGSEEEWRVWMQYTPAQWKKNREALGRAFDTTSEPGRWIQKRMFKDRAEQNARFRRASEAGSVAAAKRWDA